MKPSTSRRVVTESERECGWSADRHLLETMAQEGWDPVGFDFSHDGLVIEFEQSTPIGPSIWEYDCNQEGGPISTTVHALDHYTKDNDVEALFCFRAGTGASDRHGFYVRFYFRRPRSEERATYGSLQKWEHSAVAIKGTPRKTIAGGWVLIGVIRDSNGENFSGPRHGIYKRRVWQ